MKLVCPKEGVAWWVRQPDLIAQRGGRRYHDIILKLLDKASAELLEKMLMYLGGKLKVRSEAKGKAEAKAELLLYVISDRGLPISEQQRQITLMCI